MSTQDVFSYFKEYDPSFIEWINDTSCNVVWLDPHSAARALLGMSRPSPSYNILGQSLQQNLQHPVEPVPAPSPPPAPRQEPEAEPEPMEEGEEDEDDDFLDLVNDHETGERVRPARSRRTSPGGTPLHISPDDGEGLPDSTQQIQRPPRREETGGDNNPTEEQMDDNSMELRPVQLTQKEAFRIGVPDPKAEDMRLRYATKADKKEFGAQNKSQYYVRHGNPNYGGMKGLISSSLKKRIRQGKAKPGSSSNYGSRKRRYDDDYNSDSDTEYEDSRGRKRQNRGDLLQSGGDARSLLSRNRRPSPVDQSNSDEENVQDLPINAKFKRRMYADDIEDKIKTIRKQESHSLSRRLQSNRVSAHDRLGFGSVEPVTSMENLKVVVDSTSDRISDRLWSRNDDDDRESRRVPDLRNRLSNKRTNKRLLENLPSLSIQVEDGDYY